VPISCPSRADFDAFWRIDLDVLRVALLERGVSPDQSPATAAMRVAPQLRQALISCDVDGGARSGGLERMCRYVLRPPFAQERLRRRADGRVALLLKRAWHDGTRELVFEPLELLGAVAALMHRAFAIDVLACPQCGGRLRLIARLHDPAVIPGSSSRTALAPSQGRARSCPARARRHRALIDSGRGSRRRACAARRHPR